jgi:putative two-component system response regulator
MSFENSGYGSSILIAGGDESERNITADLLSPENYRIVYAGTGEEVLSLSASEKIDLILMDIMMPGMDSLEIVRRLKENEHTSCIPVLIIVFSAEEKLTLEVLKAGADDILVKPVDREELAARIHNFLRSKEYSDFLNYYNESLKIEIKERTTKLEEAYRETLVTLVRASEFRDEDTGFHINRIGRYSCALAELLGMDEDFIKTILLAALMHDVGKIGIPDSILLKHGKLTEEEMSVMHTHCILGAQILRGGNSRYLVMGAEIALSHHERWDGSGYPHGLTGNKIPLSARITQIADVYDALRSRRPYKSALDHATTMHILTEGDGRTMPDHFDPEILNVFRENAEMFDSIYNSSNAVSEKQGRRI